MRSRLCVVLLLLTAAVLVQSESSIEVDENGDEYDVKRFNIQGRQLNSSRSHCVVTRRKRATSVTANADNRAVQQGVLLTSPTTAPTLTANMKDGDDEQDPNKRTEIYTSSIDDDLPVIAHHEGDGEAPVALAAGAGSASNAANTNANGIVVVHTNKPPKVNPQTHAVFELLPVDQNASAESNGSKDDEDTHNFQYVFTNVDNGDNDDLHYEEEISPVSTTAIWSTGADDDHLDAEDYRDFDKLEENTTKKPVKQKPVGNKRPVSNKKKPVKIGNKQKVKPYYSTDADDDLLDGDDYGDDYEDYDSLEDDNLKPVGNKRPMSNKKPVRNGNKPNKQRPNNRGPVKKRRRPGNNNMNNFNKPLKRRPQNINRPLRQQVNRPNANRPNANRPNANRPNANRPNRRRPGAQPLRNGNWNTNRRINANLVNRNRRRKNPNDDKTLTKTMTTTQTGDGEDEDKDVNCIIINKQPEATTTTTTTARPFWNILPLNLTSLSSLANLPNLPSLNLGRVAAENGAFGKRKRVNMRFVQPTS